MLTFNLDWVQVLGLLVSIVLPVFVAIVTKWKTPSAWKVVLLALLSALTGFGTEVLQALTNHLPYNVGQGLLSALGAFLIAVVTYLGLWKPLGVSSSGNGLLSGNPNPIPEATPLHAVHFEPGAIVVQNPSYRDSGAPLASKDDVPPHA